MGFYGSNDPTNSVKALKEVVFLTPKERLQSHQVHLTMLQYYTCMQCTQNNESKQSEMDPMIQNTIQRTVSSVHVCVHCTVHNCCTQYCTEQTWWFSLLPSRQSPLLRWCLFEGRGQLNSRELGAKFSIEQNITIGHAQSKKINNMNGLLLCHLKLLSLCSSDGIIPC